jgi:hypothetical protein
MLGLHQRRNDIIVERLNVVIAWMTSQYLQAVVLHLNRYWLSSHSLATAISLSSPFHSLVFLGVPRASNHDSFHY